MPDSQDDDATSHGDAPNDGVSAVANVGTDADGALDIEPIQSDPAAHPAPPVASAAAPPAASPAAPTAPTGVAMIARLREEAEVVDDPARKAGLLHEAAELEERPAGA